MASIYGGDTIGRAATKPLRALCVPFMAEKLGLPLRRCIGDFGNKLLDEGLAERIEVPCLQHECAGAAHDVLAVIISKAARWIGVLWIPGQRPLAQDRQPVDGQAERQRLVARMVDLAAGIVGAIAGDVDGTALSGKRGVGELRDGEI